MYPFSLKQWTMHFYHFACLVIFGSCQTLLMFWDAAPKNVFWSLAFFFLRFLFLYIISIPNMGLKSTTPRSRVESHMLHCRSQWGALGALILRVVRQNQSSLWLIFFSPRNPETILFGVLWLMPQYYKVSPPLTYENTNYSWSFKSTKDCSLYSFQGFCPETTAFSSPQCAK